MEIIKRGVEHPKKYGKWWHKQRNFMRCHPVSSTALYAHKNKLGEETIPGD